MKTEYEVRILEIDIDSIKKKLDKLAEFQWDYVQKRYVYDFIPKEENKWIRLRTNGINTTLTIKDVTAKTIDGTKELEIVVNDFDMTNKMLEELGYNARSIQENKRMRYMWDGVEIDIDTWPLINTFVEFEGKDEESIRNVVLKLGLDYDASTTMDVQNIYLSLGYSLDDLNDLKFKEEI